MPVITCREIKGGSSSVVGASSVVVVIVDEVLGLQVEEARAPVAPHILLVAVIVEALTLMFSHLI